MDSSNTEVEFGYLRKCNRFWFGLSTEAPFEIYLQLILETTNHLSQIQV